MNCCFVELESIFHHHVIKRLHETVSNTHVNEVVLSSRLEEPVDGRRGLHLSAHLTGNASQLEAPAGDGLRVRVDLRTRAAAHRHCRNTIT